MGGCFAPEAGSERREMHDYLEAPIRRSVGGFTVGNWVG